MTRQEFSDAFTTMINSYNNTASFGEQSSKRDIVLDEYEKSVLLTQAQDIIVKSYFDGSLNQQGQGFDDSTRRQIDFSSLIAVSELLEYNGSVSRDTFDERGILFNIPSTVLFILNEKLVEKKTIIKDGNTTFALKNYVIVPINYKEYDREMSKPYAQPLKKQAWRLFQEGAKGYDTISELIPREGVMTIGDGTSDGDIVLMYRIRYVRRPSPIILEDLPNNLSIDGVSQASDCELNPIIHSDILNKAVEMAIATRGSYQPPQQQQQPTR